MCPDDWLKKALSVQLAALFVAIGVGFRWYRLDGQFRLAGRGEITMRLKKPMAPMARRSLGGEKKLDRTHCWVRSSQNFQEARFRPLTDP